MDQSQITQLVDKFIKNHEDKKPEYPEMLDLMGQIDEESNVLITANVREALIQALDTLGYDTTKLQMIHRGTFRNLIDLFENLQKVSPSAALLPSLEVLEPGGLIEGEKSAISLFSEGSVPFRTDEGEVAREVSRYQKRMLTTEKIDVSFLDKVAAALEQSGIIGKKTEEGKKLLALKREFMNSIRHQFIPAELSGLIETLKKLQLDQVKSPRAIFQTAGIDYLYNIIYTIAVLKEVGKVTSPKERTLHIAHPDPSQPDRLYSYHGEITMDLSTWPKESLMQALDACLTGQTAEEKQQRIATLLDTLHTITTKHHDLPAYELGVILRRDNMVKDLYALMQCVQTAGNDMLTSVEHSIDTYLEILFGKFRFDTNDITQSDTFITAIQRLEALGSFDMHTFRKEVGILDGKMPSNFETLVTALGDSFGKKAKEELNVLVRKYIDHQVAVMKNRTSTTQPGQSPDERAFLGYIIGVTNAAKSTHESTNQKVLVYAETKNATQKAVYNAIYLALRIKELSNTHAQDPAKTLEKITQLIATFQEENYAYTFEGDNEILLSRHEMMNRYISLVLTLKTLHIPELLHELHQKKWKKGRKATDLDTQLLLMEICDKTNPFSLFAIMIAGLHTMDFQSGELIPLGRTDTNEQIEELLEARIDTIGRDKHLLQQWMGMYQQLLSFDRVREESIYMDEGRHANRQVQGLEDLLKVIAELWITRQSLSFPEAEATRLLSAELENNPGILQWSPETALPGEDYTNAEDSAALISRIQNHEDPVGLLKRYFEHCEVEEGVYKLLSLLLETNRNIFNDLIEELITHLDSDDEEYLVTATDLRVLRKNIASLLGTVSLQSTWTTTYALIRKVFSQEHGQLDVGKKAEGAPVVPAVKIEEFLEEDFLANLETLPEEEVARLIDEIEEGL